MTSHPHWVRTVKQFEEKVKNVAASSGLRHFKILHEQQNSKANNESGEKG